MTLREIIEEAKKLSRDEQVDLIDELYCMINVDPDSVSLTPAQAADLERRLNELEAGEAKMIPGDLAMEALRKRQRRNGGLDVTPEQFEQ
jgi:putative addiction module component (TIGR02574 family)